MSVPPLAPGSLEALCLLVVEEAGRIECTDLVAVLAELQGEEERATWPRAALAITRLVRSGVLLEHRDGHVSVSDGARP